MEAQAGMLFFPFAYVLFVMSTRLIICHVIVACHRADFFACIFLILLVFHLFLVAAYLFYFYCLRRNLLGFDRKRRMRRTLVLFRASSPCSRWVYQRFCVCFRMVWLPGANPFRCIFYPICSVTCRTPWRQPMTTLICGSSTP